MWKYLVGGIYQRGDLKLNSVRINVQGPFKRQKHEKSSNRGISHQQKQQFLLNLRFPSFISIKPLEYKITVMIFETSTHNPQKKRKRKKNPKCISANTLLIYCRCPKQSRGLMRILWIWHRPSSSSCDLYDCATLYVLYPLTRRNLKEDDERIVRPGQADCVPVVGLGLSWRFEFRVRVSQWDWDTVCARPIVSLSQIEGLD